MNEVSVWRIRATTLIDTAEHMVIANTLEDAARLFGRKFEAYTITKVEVLYSAWTEAL